MNYVIYIYIYICVCTYIRILFALTMLTTLARNIICCPAATARAGMLNSFAGLLHDVCDRPETRRINRRPQPSG